MLREKGSIIERLTEISDLILIGSSFLVTIELYEQKIRLSSDLLQVYFILFLIYIFSWLIAVQTFKFYQSRRFMAMGRELKEMLKAHMFTLGASLILINLYDPRLYTDRFIFYFSAFSIVATFGLHLSTRAFLQSIRRSGRNTRYILLIGEGKSSKQFLDKVKDNTQLGYKVIGYLAPAKNGLNLPYLGDYSSLESVIKVNVVDQVVVTSSITDREVHKALELLEDMGTNTTIVLDEFISRIKNNRSLDFDGMPMVAYDTTPIKPFDELMKRIVDVTLTSIGLIVISPVLLIIALAIKLTSKGPIIFSQERVGLNGRIFKMYKFRSMVINAEELKEKLAHLNEMSGPVFKITNDPRVTAIGKFLRKTSLDEFPQLWNVIKGDMSLVGPRPPLPSEVNMYDPKHRKRLAVRPGITCIWQISGRNQVGFNEWMEMDARYVEERSFWLDMEILFKTVPVVLLRKGAS